MKNKNKKQFDLNSVYPSMEIKLAKCHGETFDVKVDTDFISNYEEIKFDPNKIFHKDAIPYNDIDIDGIKKLVGKENVIVFMNLNNIIENDEISESNYIKMEKQFSYLLHILDINSSKYGDPYLCGFMHDKDYNDLNYKEDPFKLYKMVVDMQDYVFEKRNELRGV